MKNEVIAKGFKDHLIDSADFKIIKIHDYHFKIKSDCCEIDLLFERYEDGYGIEINEPGSKKEPLNLLLLRFLRGAVESVDVDTNNPGRYAILLNEYFSDLLKGDFSIRKQYKSVYDEFYDKYFEAQSIDRNEPIWEKIAKFDISWMNEM